MAAASQGMGLPVVSWKASEGQLQLLAQGSRAGSASASNGASDPQLGESMVDFDMVAKQGFLQDSVEESNCQRAELHQVASEEAPMTFKIMGLNAAELQELRDKMEKSWRMLQQPTPSLLRGCNLQSSLVAKKSLTHGVNAS